MSPPGSATMISRQHRRLSRAVDAWVDGELDAVTACRIAAHVRVCWSCSSAAETGWLIKRALGLRADREPPGLAAARLERFASRLARI